MLSTGCNLGGSGRLRTRWSHGDGVWRGIVTREPTIEQHGAYGKINKRDDKSSQVRNNGTAG